MLAAAAKSTGGMVRILELAQFERWSTQKARKRLETKWGGPLRMAGETIADDDSESEA